MSINRLLLIAGLLAIGACHPNPNAVCAVDDQTVNLDTEEYLCPDFGGPTTGSAQQDATSDDDE